MALCLCVWQACLVCLCACVLLLATLLSGCCVAVNFHFCHVTNCLRIAQGTRKPGCQCFSLLLSLSSPDVGTKCWLDTQLFIFVSLSMVCSVCLSLFSLFHILLFFLPQFVTCHLIVSVYSASCGWLIKCMFFLCVSIHSARQHESSGG